MLFSRRMRNNTVGKDNSSTRRTAKFPSGDFCFHSGQDDYSHKEFKPFNLINDLVEKNHNANANFTNRIISYINKTYNMDVPVPQIDGQTLPMGFRPVYQTYVDTVIEHLGGKSFRETAEEELLAHFLKAVQPSRWSKVNS